MKTAIVLFVVCSVLLLLIKGVHARPGVVSAVDAGQRQNYVSCMAKWLSLSSDSMDVMAAVRIERALILLPQHVDESNIANMTEETLGFLLGGIGVAREFYQCISKRTARCRREAPCQNGGRCLYAQDSSVSGEGEYNCSCVAAHTGMFCEINATLCSPNPCQNGATCRVAVEASSSVYECVCPDLYTGRHCERKWLEERRMVQFENAVLGLGSKVEKLENNAGTSSRDQRLQIQTFLRNLRDEVREDMRHMNASVLSQLEELQIAVRALDARMDDHTSEHVTIATTTTASSTPSTTRPAVRCSRGSGGESGVFTAQVPGSSYTAYCDQQTDGGGWTVFQRRQDGSVNFNRTWTDYQRGFGSADGEFWLGLDTIHQLTSQPGEDYELRVDITFTDTGVKHFEKMSRFRVAGAGDSYRLTVTGWSSPTLTQNYGMSGDIGRQFSTIDRDNDFSGISCAVEFGGAWWHRPGCSYAAVNGVYGAAFPHGIRWYYPSASKKLRFSEMKIRPLA